MDLPDAGFRCLCYSRHTMHLRYSRDEFSNYSKTRCVKRKDNIIWRVDTCSAVCSSDSLCFIISLWVFTPGAMKIVKSKTAEERQPEYECLRHFQLSFIEPIVSVSCAILALSNNSLVVSCGLAVPTLFLKMSNFAPLLLLPPEAMRLAIDWLWGPYKEDVFDMSADSLRN